MKYTEENMNRLFYIIDTQKRYEKAFKELEAIGVRNDNLIIHILDEIVLNNDSFLETMGKGSELYRARKLELDDFNNHTKGVKVKYELDVKKGRINFSSTGYDYDNSRECPLGKSRCGRGNIEGMSFLYLADDVPTACSEIDSTIRDIISLATFRVKQNLKLIDLKDNKNVFTLQENDKYGVDLSILIKELIFSFCKPVSRKEGYKGTQIISDYIRKAGFDGIKYKSFYTGESNYVIFNSHKSIIDFVDSRLLIYEYVDKQFYDCNNDEVIIASQDKKRNEYSDRLTALSKLIKFK